MAVGTDPPLTPELVEWVRTYRHLYRLELSDAAVAEAAKKARTYREFVSALFSEYGRRRGKPLAGEKSPGYVRHLPRLHALFPWARVIHIIRRFASWDEDPVTTAALWWELMVRQGRDDGKALGPELYREAGHEALVSRPKEGLAALCDFLDIPYDDAMLRFHEGRTRSDPDLSTNRSWLPPTPGTRNWRSQMSDEDVERFEAAPGELLNDLGYGRAVPSPSAAVMEHSSRVRRSFTRGDGSRAPERW